MNEITMNSSEAAEFLKVSVGTLRNWVNQKKLPAHHAGRKLVFFRNELENFLRGARKSALADALVSIYSDWLSTLDHEAVRAEALRLNKDTGGAVEALKVLLEARAPLADLKK